MTSFNLVYLNKTLHEYNKNADHFDNYLYFNQKFWNIQFMLFKLFKFTKMKKLLIIFCF